MRRETKFFALSSVVALLAGGVPWVLNEKKKAERDALINRAPNAATKKFRDVVKSATEIRAYSVMHETMSVAEPDLCCRGRTPVRILKGRQTQEFISGLHFETWNADYFPPVSATVVTSAAVFFKDEKILADLRLLGFRSRWYKNNLYQRGGIIEPESMNYAEEMLA